MNCETLVRSKKEKFRYLRFRHITIRSFRDLELDKTLSNPEFVRRNLPPPEELLEILRNDINILKSVS